MTNFKNPKNSNCISPADNEERAALPSHSRSVQLNQSRSYHGNISPQPPDSRPAFDNRPSRSISTGNFGLPVPFGVPPPPLNGDHCLNVVEMARLNSLLTGARMTAPFGSCRELRRHFEMPMSSDSDDLWSEPDVNESRARVGLRHVTNFVPSQHVPKTRPGRAKGRSSAGEI